MRTKAAILAISLLVITSCATRFQLKSPESTLLIIPVDNEYEKSSEIFGHYELVIRNLPDKEIVAKKKLINGDGYMVIRDLPPGEYYVASSRFFYQDNSPGSIQRYNPFNHHFIMRAGYITFTPWIYGQSNHLNENGGYTMNRYNVKSPGGVRQKVLYDELMEKYPEEIGQWKVESFSGE